jgi:hypothetical protein
MENRRSAPRLEVIMAVSRACLSAAATLALAGCFAGSPVGEQSDIGPSSTRRIVIQIPDQSTPTSLVTLLQMRVRNMDVRRRSGTCPEIEFRGRNSISMPENPSVYVDGQHASDTCVLDLISPVDVDFLEVYPMGVSNRAGYFTNSGGLILVFTKNGDM